MKLQTTQCIYVMHNPLLNITKIGITDNLTVRKCGLEGSSGCRLTLSYNTHYLINASYYESIAHSKLADKRGIGEWFNVTPEQAIKAVQEAVSEAKLDRILLAYKDGETITKIAKDNNVSRQAIIWRLRHYGVYNDGSVKQNIEVPKPISIPTKTTTEEVYLDNEEPKLKEAGMKRIEANIFYNGEWYKASKYSNGVFTYAYSKDIDKARKFINSVIA